MRILTYTATAEDSGKKVRQLLRGSLHLSYTLLKSLKWRENAILLNGRPCTVAAVVCTGDILTVNVTDANALSEHITPVDYPLDVLYEDDDLLVINKPAHIAVHSAEPVTVAGAVAHYLNGAAFHPVNRLDKGVTGIMVIAKNGHIHDLCMRQLHTDAFRREYLAVCEGVPAPPSGTIDLPIGRDPSSILKRRIDPDGLESHTVYETVQLADDRALLRLRPLTGRTHQLRLHCAAIGHPLVGDWLYGTENRALIDRPALHSHELWLTHPITGQQIHLNTPLPDDMQNLL